MSWLDTLEDIRSKDFAASKASERDKAGRDVINMASYACAVVAVSPIPFSDAVLMLPVQSAMVMTLGHVYGRKLTQADSKKLIVELGATAGVSLLARQGIKALLPVVGALLTVPAAYAANWAIGRVAMEYFKNPEAAPDQLKKVYQQAKEEGAKLFSKERFEQFRHRQSQDEPDEEVSDETQVQPKKTKEKKKVGKKKVRGSAKRVEFDLAKRLKANPAVRDAFNEVLHLEVVGDDPGQWTVDFRQDDDWVRAGLLGKAGLKLTVDSGILSRLFDGTLPWALALNAKQIQATDVPLALRLAPLFDDA
jgi:uncharacterized protein (DUF697 family)